MSAVLDWFTAVLFTVYGQPVTIVALIGLVTGVLSVVALTRQYVWNWPVGILNSLAFLVLFLGSDRYANAALEVPFALLGVYGWVSWRRHATAVSAMPVTRATARQIAYGVVFTAIGTVVVAFLLAAETGSDEQWLGAFVLAASLFALWLQAAKVIEQWWVWIVVDLVSIPLYAAQGLWLTAAVFLVLLALSWYGLVLWTRDLRASRTTDSGDEARDAESESLSV